MDRESGTTRRSAASPRVKKAAAINNVTDEDLSTPLTHNNTKEDTSTTTQTLRDDASGGGSSSSSSVSYNVMAGLTVAGMAASLLTTVFGIFHVDLFLNAYHLPLATYSVGNVIYSMINTANDVAGAWIVDQVAATSGNQRSDLVGMTGCLFAVCFLAPFLRPWKQASNWLWDGTHFVVSLSLYDTMYSFAMILYGSIVMDDHEMTESRRIRFLVICKVVNLACSFGVARMGLYLFDTENLESFRLFVLALATVVCILSVISQGLIVGKSSFSLQHIVPPKVTKTDDDASSTQKTRPLEWRRVLRDFWKHKNFRAWIGMEMLLESQNTFNFFFRKTFVDRLVAANGVDKETCDWMMSAMKPVTAILSLAAFIPIRKFGYPKVYRFMFVANLTFALLMLFVADSTATHWIVAFLIIYPVLTSSIQSAGFSLGMADLVMDLKHTHATDGRYDEPSLAGLFMGTNALLCKPMESFLPVVAAQAMRDEANAQRNLFYVLVLPPLIFSCLQLLSWKNYELGPKRAAQMRKELKTLLSSQSDSERV